jgi:hypothetical protein
VLLFGCWCGPFACVGVCVLFLLFFFGLFYSGCFGYLWVCL